MGQRVHPVNRCKKRENNRMELDGTVEFFSWYSVKPSDSCLPEMFAGYCNEISPCVFTDSLLFTDTVPFLY